MRDYIFWFAIILGVWLCGIRIGQLFERDRQLRKSRPKPAKAIMPSPADDDWDYKPTSREMAREWFPPADHADHTAEGARAEAARYGRI
jgi:hypothetical protein